MRVYLALVVACVALSGQERPGGRWIVSDKTSEMDGVRKVHLFSLALDGKASISLSCERGKLDLYFSSHHGFKMHDVNCNASTSGLDGWLGGRRCANMTYLRWRFDPPGKLFSHFVERSDDANTAWLTSAAKRMFPLLLKSQSVKLEFSTVRDGVMVSQIDTSGLAEVATSLIDAGCRVKLR